MTDLDSVVSKAIAEFGGTKDAAELERVKAGYLGKSGVLAEAMKDLAEAELAEVLLELTGRAANSQRRQIEPSGLPKL